MGKVYNQEYKVEICKRITEYGETVAGVSRETGINTNSLYTWVQRYRENKEKPFTGSGHVKAENEELSKLQKEIRELREENEILKKAAAFFAKNQK